MNKKSPWERLLVAGNSSDLVDGKLWLYILTQERRKWKTVIFTVLATLKIDLRKTDSEEK